MFFVWGSTWKYKAKENGLRLNKMCPECNRRGIFYEVVPTKYFTLFWIPIVSTETKKPLLECSLCHERFYIQEHDYINAIKENNTAAKLSKPTVIQMPYDDHSKNKYIVFQCENCGQKLRIPPKDELLKITCTKCKNIFLFQNGKKA